MLVRDKPSELGEFVVYKLNGTSWLIFKLRIKKRMKVEEKYKILYAWFGSLLTAYNSKDKQLSKFISTKL